MAAPHILRLKQLAAAGRWWHAAAAVQSRVADPDALLIEAQAWARLGLPTLASAALDRLCTTYPAAGQHPGVLELRGSVASQPADQIPQTELVKRAEAAVANLSARGIDLGDALERWRRASDTSKTFLASDGNAVRRLADGSLELVGDHRAASAALIAQHATALARSNAPITIEGLDPPWLALDLLRATAGEGYTPGIRIVQADAVEMLDGLSLIETGDSAELLGADRVEWFIGPSAASHLAQAITKEPGVAHEGPVVPLATLRARLGPALATAMRSAAQRHTDEHLACVETLRQRDNSPDAHRRLAVLADENPSRPRRIALIAGRFTTVLRPMIEDLAGAFESLGCATRLITEPSDHRRLTPFGYSRLLTEFDPDLIVSANHTRDDMDRLLGERLMPTSVPWVTWVQDAMPHLLRREAGRSIGPIDLAVGHISSAMRDRFGYPTDRSIIAPMVASEQKFSPDRVDPRLAVELACEVASFTNHSETPEQMRARLIDEVSGAPGAAVIVERVANRALELAEEPIERISARHRCATIIDEEAPGADAESRENLFENVAMRLYDRACRHAALHWARGVCEANGWRLAIYGKGWDQHRTLGAHARGTIAHGTDLCTAYHAARVSLDTSVLSSFHQRVAECVLAGGLPAMLVTGAACLFARAGLKRTMFADRAAHATPVPGRPGSYAFPTYRVPEAARFMRFSSVLHGRSYPYAIIQPDPSVPPAGIIDADEAMGLLELGMWDAASLERLVRRAHESAWREARRERVLSYVRDNCTHAVLAQQILRHYAELVATESTQTAAV